MGTTSSPHGPYVQGLTHATIAGTAGRHRASGSQPPKAGASPDRRLQPACVKPELLVTAGQHTAVNMFPGLVHTARHVMEADNTRSRWANRKEAAVEGGIGDWDEVVTR